MNVLGKASHRAFVELGSLGYVQIVNHTVEVQLELGALDKRRNIFQDRIVDFKMQSW